MLVLTKESKQMSTLKILNEIAAEPSTNAKQAIILREKDNLALRETFAAAYNPTISYYIRKIPDYTTAPGVSMNLHWAINELTSLSSRKVTGQAGVDFLKNILENVSASDAKVIERIIDTDLKCGCSDSIASRVWKGLVPEFPYMRCSLPKDAKFNKWNWKAGVYVQLKGDGMFANFDLADGEVAISSRNGSKFDSKKFAGVVADALVMFPSDYRMIGELLVERNGEILPRTTGNGILNSVLKGGDFDKGDTPVYMVWDIIPLSVAVAKGRFETPYKERFEALSEYVALKPNAGVTLINSKIVYSLKEAYKFYFELVALGFEGAIVKKAEGIWFDGTSKEQIKLKVECDVDLKIVGFTVGNGKLAKTFGSITCETSDGLLEVGVSGIPDKLRDDIHRRREELLNTIMTVTFNDIMYPSKPGKKHSLFSPRFAELRTDKTVADSLPRVIEQFEAIIKAEEEAA